MGRAAFKGVMKPLTQSRGSRSEAAVEGARRPFEGVDLHEAGRRGGQASGISHRLRPQRELEERIKASGNGYAQLALLRIERERQKALEREQIRLDREVVYLTEAAEKERELIASYREEAARELMRRDEIILERRRAEGALHELEQHKAKLHAALQADETALLDRLRELHAAGGLESLLIALDIFDFEEVGEDKAVSPSS
jgi:hypothetical protein